MKLITKLALGLFLSLSSLSRAADNIFWIDQFSVTSSPGNPLTGSGLGSMSGNFSNVTWEGTNLGSMSGSFSINLSWQDADPLVGFGIPWSVDNTLDAIVFDTNPGDFLTFGTASITGATAPPGYKICGLKTLICVDLSSNLESEISLSSGKGEKLYYGFGTKGEYYEFNYSGKNYALDETIKSTDELSFFYSGDGGRTKTEFTRGIEFDTGVKIGGCVCVPEPSGAVLLASVGLVLIVRRRRHLR